MSSKDGGPAFPAHNGKGMSLRDYFAIRIWPYAKRQEGHGFMKTARRAYEMADCMLKAREE